jgi:hypothetical protein
VSTFGDDDCEGPADQSSDPIAAAQRYGRPDVQRGEETAPSAVVARRSHGAPSRAAAGPNQSRAPLVLGVIGIVCWFLCGIGAVASTIVGAIGHPEGPRVGSAGNSACRRRVKADPVSSPES